MERATDPATRMIPMSLRQQLQGAISGLELGTVVEQRLLEALHAEVKRNPVMARVDQVLVNEDRVFAVYRPFGEQPPVHHVNVPLRGVQQTSATGPVVGADGYLTDHAVTRHEVPGLGRSSMGEPVALVMHRTESATAASALKSFASGRDGVQYGTHFLIDKDGTIYQTASLGQKTLHVGKIKSRCVEEGTCSVEESRLAEKRGFNPTATHNHEKAKQYPQRYPLNEDSVGIEVVARHVDGSWEAPTAAQTVAINRLVGILQQQYGLGEQDVYAHDVVSYKTLGEGAGLYQPAAVVDNERVQQGGPSR
jgi:hypothetical protein